MAEDIDRALAAFLDRQRHAASEPEPLAAWLVEFLDQQEREFLAVAERWRTMEG